MNSSEPIFEPPTEDGEHRPPYALPSVQVATVLGTNLNAGLSEEEVVERLQRFGPNRLREEPGPTFWELLIQQFSSFLILLLVGAAAISLFIGEWLDAAVIVAIVVANATIGVIQEQQAGQALRALQRIAASRAKVVRGGRVVEVLSENLVPGDLVLLETGANVPADIRLVDAVNLEINEAALTGESVPVSKSADTVLDPATPLGDLANSAFMGTTVTRGRGRGIITSTGMETQIGEIAAVLQRFEEQVTPLQRKLAELGQGLGYAVIAVAIIVVGLGFFQGRPLLETFLVAVSLAVAAIPEGLPAVVTVVLAIGLQRMARRHALIRRLPAVETLGSVTTIASDKTGTLTEGQMTVVRVFADGREVSVTGEGYRPEGAFKSDGTTVKADEDPVLRLLLTSAVLANDAVLEPSGRTDGHRTWRVIGDPTEGALLVAGGKAGLWRQDLDTQYPRQNEVPFSSERKLMTTIHPNPDGKGLVAFSKGGPGVVVDRCRYVQTADGVRELTPEDRQRILETNDRFAGEALRVLGVAYRNVTDQAANNPESAEQDMVFLGLIGMIDPPRAEARDAIALAREAGVRPVMITGDYLRTGVAVASSLELLRPGGLAISGDDLDKMDDSALDEAVERVDVFARATPKHKVRVIESLHRLGHVVAMTGDGVNDAPALKRADIGIAMGITGTDVAKEAAAMVLTDDNFASIVSAVEEGRIIYANIRKFVAYLLSANLGEIIIIVTGIAAGLPLILQPIQLLWINLVTDGFPALALGVERAEPGIMRDPPRSPKEGIISGALRYWLVAQGLLDAAATLAAFLIGLQLFPGQLAAAQTLAFATLVTSELLRAHSARSLRRPIYKLGIVANRAMVYATLFSFALLLVVIYVPFLANAFGTVPLGGREWLLVIGLALIPFIGSELAKPILNWQARRSAEKRSLG